jgi:hypothetical protein
MFRATVGRAAIFIDASPEFPKEVLNAAGGVIFHKNAKDVDSGDTELASGSTVQITEGMWFVSTTSAEGVFRELKTGRFEDGVVTDDLTVGDDATIGDKLVVNGEAELNGDLNHDGAKVGFIGAAPVAAQAVKPAAEVTAKELCEALEKFGLVT